MRHAFRRTDSAHVAHGIVITDVGKCRYGEIIHLPEPRVKHKVARRVPVAADILWAGVARACCVVVDHTVGNGVLGLLEREVERHALLAVSVVAAIRHTQIIVPRGFQTGITERDVQRVGIVNHCQEVGHRRLRSRTAIIDFQYIGLGNLVAETDLRRNVEHLARHERIEILPGTEIVEFCFLGVKRDAHVGADFGGVVANACRCRVVGILIGGVATVVVVAHLRPDVGFRGRQRANQGICGRVAKRTVGIFVEIIERTVAVGIFVRELVAHFGKPVLAERLHVAEAHAVVPIRRGIVGVLVGKVARLIVLEIFDRRNAEAAALGVGVAAVGAERNVASVAAQAAHNHQETLRPHALDVAKRFFEVAVHGHVFQTFRHREFVLENAVKGRHHAFHGIRVIVERAAARVAAGIVLRKGKRGAEDDVCHRVGAPLQAQAAVHVRGAAVAARGGIAVRAG